MAKEKNEKTADPDALALAKLLRPTVKPKKKPAK